LLPLLLCLLLTQALGLPRAAARDTAASLGPVDPYADVLPGALDRARQAAQELSAYRMDVTLDPEASTLGGDLELSWRNPATEPLDDVWFRLFPNADYYGTGNLTVTNVTVDGATVTPELSLGDTALRVPLPQAVEPGARAEIAMTFTATVPADSTGSYGIYTHETKNGTWVLADWYPILSVWEEGSGWSLPPVTSFGDPTYSPSAFYDVTLRTPQDLAVMATGVVAGETGADGIATRRFAAGPARDFVIVADDDETPLRKSVDGTQVTLWTAPDISTDVAARTLDLGTEALHFYNDTFGQLPAREIDLVQTDPRGALGIAWTGLVFLDGPGLLATYGEHDPEGLADIVGHEVSHLWWGVMVGGDSNKHGFIQEGLATVSSLLFLQESMGDKAASEGLDSWVIRPARDLLASGDAVVDLPSNDGDDETIRSNAIYGKGSLGFLAIRQAIGAEAFEAALRDVAIRYAWGEMTPEQLREAFERASGQDLKTLWSHWFDEAALTKAEIETLARTFDQ
jgi:hypothetical protein